MWYLSLFVLSSVGKFSFRHLNYNTLNQLNQYICFYFFILIKVYYYRYYNDNRIIKYMNVLSQIIYKIQLYHILIYSYLNFYIILSFVF